MYSWIDYALIGLQDTYNTNDIYELYDYLKIQLVKLEQNTVLLHGNEAFYHRDYFENEVVFIRKDLNLKYEKFILAHELGHALLHTHLYEAAFNKSLLNTGKLEKQANYFALKLSNLKFDKVELEGMTLEQISKYLCIPYEILAGYT